MHICVCVCMCVCVCKTTTKETLLHIKLFIWNYSVYFKLLICFILYAKFRTLLKQCYAHL
jgi:hypothetical protein